jgi:hypothetical protein
MRWPATQGHVYCSVGVGVQSRLSSRDCRNHGVGTGIRQVIYKGGSEVAFAKTRRSYPLAASRVPKKAARDRARSTKRHTELGRSVTSIDATNDHSARRGGNASIPNAHIPHDANRDDSRTIRTRDLHLQKTVGRPLRSDRSRSCASRDSPFPRFGNRPHIPLAARASQFQF